MTRTISKEPTSCAAPPFWEIPEWSHFQENLTRHHQFTGTKLGPLLSVKLWYLKVLSHLIRFECELNSHSPDAHRMRIESTSISFTLPTFWRATPTAAQATISTLTLLSQHSRCIETQIPCRCSRLCEMWISTIYTGPLGKRSLFRQQVISGVPAW